VTVACGIHHWKQISIPHVSRVPKLYVLVYSTYHNEVEVKDVTGTVNLLSHNIFSVINVDHISEV
jgi:hypothetical protein